MFSGLRSLCIILLLWRYSTADEMSFTKHLTSYSFRPQQLSGLFKTCKDIYIIKGKQWQLNFFFIFHVQTQFLGPRNLCRATEIDIWGSPVGNSSKNAKCCPSIPPLITAHESLSSSQMFLRCIWYNLMWLSVIYRINGWLSKVIGI